jgi:hypothetical protein
METKQYICNKCLGVINSSGYTVITDCHATGEFLNIAIIGGILQKPEMRPQTVHGVMHYCGKHCLMLALNTMVDSIKTGRSTAETAAAQPPLSHPCEGGGI